MNHINSVDSDILSKIPSPCFVLEESLLEKNMNAFAKLQAEAPVKVLLALKGFALFHAFSLLKDTLKGASASSLWEAQLAAEEFGREVYVYSPAYRDEDLPAILDYASHLTFNSLSQWERFRAVVETSSSHPSIGIRINPQYSPVETELYNPCQPSSRLGVMSEALGEKLPDGIDGFLCHNLCESDSYAMETTLSKIEYYFGRFLPKIKWLNLGGGHLVTGKEYNINHAIKVLKEFNQRHPHIQLILEPGSAIAWQTGFLLSTVRDLIPTPDIIHAMLDVSFTAHMTDCLEMPYRPIVRGERQLEDGEKGYRLGGASCLAGDFLGDFAFPKDLSIGDRIIFEDMMHYTMVKSTMFNGVVHPSIGIINKDRTFTLWREFCYQDYRSRMG